MIKKRLSVKVIFDFYCVFCLWQINYKDYYCIIVYYRCITGVLLPPTTIGVWTTKQEQNETEMIEEMLGYLHAFSFTFFNMMIIANIGISQHLWHQYLKSYSLPVPYYYWVIRCPWARPSCSSGVAQWPVDRIEVVLDSFQVWMWSERSWRREHTKKYANEMNLLVKIAQR